MQSHTLSSAKIAVVGAGTMGIGIAQLSIVNGHQTVLYDQDFSRLQQQVKGLEQTLQKLVDKQKITVEQRQQALANLSLAKDLKELADVDMVVEAIVEQLAVKQDLFVNLANHCKETTILASNTSSISITAIASVVPHPERVVGLHFFNPAPVMKLVEIVQGLKTPLSLCQVLQDLMTTWKKVPVLTKSTPGFIVNRIARPFYSEGFRALQDQVTDVGTLDFALKECGAFAMGPCELTDLIGQDVNFSVTQSVYQAFFYEPRYRPSLVQQELVDAKCFGRKTGQGFYQYVDGQKQELFALTNVESVPVPQVNIRNVGQSTLLDGLVQRLASSFTIHDEKNADTHTHDIWLGDICLKHSHGESVNLSYGEQKTLLIDYHHDWNNAKAIVMTANYACQTADKTLVEQVFAQCGLTVIWVTDHPALLTLRTIAMLINEACEAVLHGIASPKDIDNAMKYGVNYPKGPFEWLEQIGTRVVLNVLNQLYQIYGEEKYRPSFYLKQYVAKQCIDAPDKE